MFIQFSLVRGSAMFCRWFPALALGCIFAAVGCTGGSAMPKTVPVKGTVVFRDKPLAKARVTFYAKGSSINPSVETNDQGQFELGIAGKGAGVAPGANVVTVVLVADGTAGPAVMDPSAMLKGGGAAPGKAEMPVVGGSSVPGGNSTSLPTIYGNAANSPLKFTIGDKGEADLKVELK